MNEPLKASEVLSQILFEMRMNANQFAKSIGVLPTQIYDILNSKVKSITPEMADKIRAVYCQYSRMWLISGEGSPYINNGKQDDDLDPQGVADSDNGIIDFESGDWAGAFRSLMKEMALQRRMYAAHVEKHLSLLEKAIAQTNILISNIEQSKENRHENI